MAKMSHSANEQRYTYQGSAEVALWLRDPYIEIVRTVSLVKVRGTPGSVFLCCRF